MQEGHWAIVNTVMEKRMKARGPGHPQGLRKTAQPSAAAYNIDDWIRGLDEEASDGQVNRAGYVDAYGALEVVLVLNVLVEVVDDRGNREYLELMDASLEVHPCQRVGTLIEGVNEVFCLWQW